MSGSTVSFALVTGKFNVTEAISDIDTIAVLEDLPEQGLSRGQVGTVVETLAPDVYEVEFSDNSGRTYATATIPPPKLS